MNKIYVEFYREATAGGVFGLYNNIALTTSRGTIASINDYDIENRRVIGFLIDTDNNKVSIYQDGTIFSDTEVNFNNSLDFRFDISIANNCSVYINSGQFEFKYSHTDALTLSEYYSVDKVVWKLKGTSGGTLLSGDGFSATGTSSGYSIAVTNPPNRMVGEQLTSPESGWKRYDQSNSSIDYHYDINVHNRADLYNGSQYQSSQPNGYYKFDFIGTKFRIIEAYGPNRNNNMQVTIDGNIIEGYGNYASADKFQYVVYEKAGLHHGRHTIEVRKTDTDTTTWYSLDALDIDADGRLLHPNEVLEVDKLNIGKRIRAHYTAKSGAVGVSSGLGKETSDFISPTSSATPNGDFYYICVDKDHLGRWKLIADRNIQHSISWDTLNNEGIASGSGIPLPTMSQRAGANAVLSDLGLTSTADAQVVANSIATRGVSGSGKYYWECRVIAASATGSIFLGISTDGYNIDDVNQWVGTKTGSSAIGYSDAGKIKTNGVEKASVLTYGSGATIGFGLDLDNDSLSFYTDGVLMYKQQGISLLLTGGNVYYPTMGTYAGYSASVNFGDKPFKYSIPDGFKSYKDAFKITHKSTLRLLTGGISSTDKDNEWDNYVVNSTLNGAIKAGDNFVWNWSGLYTSTSTTQSGSATNKIARGSTAVDGIAPITTTSATGNATLRPVLLIELMFINKTLIHYNGEYKKFDRSLEVPNWITVSSSLPTEQEFLEHGMDTIDYITSDELLLLGDISLPIEIETYTTGTELKTLNYNAIPFDKVIVPTKDIDITNVLNIDYFRVDSIISGQGIVKVAVSFDTGLSWYAWDSVNNLWKMIDLSLNSIGVDGMAPNVMNSITDVNWNELRGNSNTVRFAYFLSMSNSSDIASVDNLVSQFDLKGAWKYYKEADWIYSSNTMLTVQLYHNGDYKINY
jgi:SPRY domain